MALTIGDMTEEDRALLGHPDPPAEEAAEAERFEDVVEPVLAGYRERLLLGDLSW